jgi:hypothetical protein
LYFTTKLRLTVSRSLPAPFTWRILDIIIPRVGMRTATQPFHFTSLLGSDNGVWHLNSLTFMDSFHRTSRNLGRSQKSRGIRRGSSAARLLGLWVWIPPGLWMFVSRVVCCHAEVSGSGWSLIQRSSTECVCVCLWSQSINNVQA